DRAIHPDLRIMRSSARHSVVLLALAFEIAAIALAQNATGGPPPAELQIVKTYCAGCHGGSNPKGDLVLPTDAVDYANQRAIWIPVLERVTDGTMPPDGKPQPTADQRTLLAGW